MKEKKKDSATHKFQSQSVDFLTLGACSMHLKQFALSFLGTVFDLIHTQKRKKKNIKTKRLKMNTLKCIRRMHFFFLQILVFIRCRCRIQYFIFYQRYEWACADFTTFYVLLSVHFVTLLPFFRLCRRSYLTKGRSPHSFPFDKLYIFIVHFEKKFFGSIT